MWAGHVASTGNRRISCRIFVRKLEIKTPLGRPRHRWEDNIEIDVQGVG
jgi:hypothetical protein